MPLAMVKAGEKQAIKRILGKDDTKKFLENLGFVIGEYITVISEIEGNMIVSVKSSKVAISRSMALRIIV